MEAKQIEMKDATSEKEKDEEYAYFCTKITELTGINLHSYRSAQMKRRLTSYMRKHQIFSFVSFAEHLEKAQTELDKLVDYFTINVTQFFRDAKQWGVLISKVIPLLGGIQNESGKALRVWSAGCSAGQEAYSAAIAFKEASQDVSVLGTDIDQPSLGKAVVGRYSVREMKGVPENILNKYFAQEGSSFAVSEELRRVVRFKRHSLLGAAYPKNLDLVFCRNVLIYFNDQGREYVVSKVALSLKPGGVLFMGGTEAIFNCHKYGLEQIYPFFYQRFQ